MVLVSDLILKIRCIVVMFFGVLFGMIVKCMLFFSWLYCMAGLIGRLFVLCVKMILVIGLIGFVVGW